jgi:hypothetical protein
MRGGGSAERSSLQAKAERAVVCLRDRESVDDLRRRVFYNLVLAQLMRDIPR